MRLLERIDSAPPRAARLAPPRTSDFDLVARMIADVADVPVVLISKLDGEAHVFVGTHGIARESADQVTPLCLEVVTLERPVLMQDARRHLALGARAAHGTALVSFMGLPIIGRDGKCLGAMSAFRQEHHCWGGRDLIVLRSFVALLSTLIAEQHDQAHWLQLDRWSRTPRERT